MFLIFKQKRGKLEYYTAFLFLVFSLFKCFNCSIYLNIAACFSFPFSFHSVCFLFVHHYSKKCLPVSILSVFQLKFLFSPVRIFCFMSFDIASQHNLPFFLFFIFLFPFRLWLPCTCSQYKAKWALWFVFPGPCFHPNFNVYVFILILAIYKRCQYLPGTELTVDSADNTGG